MPDILRHGSGTWAGDLPSGTGSASTESGALDHAKVTFATRFAEPQTGSNPEELLAAAHASCFSMAPRRRWAAAAIPPKRSAPKPS